MNLLNQLFCKWRSRDPENRCDLTSMAGLGRGLPNRIKVEAKVALSSVLFFTVYKISLPADILEILNPLPRPELCRERRETIVCASCLPSVYPQLLSSAGYSPSNQPQRSSQPSLPVNPLGSLGWATLYLWLLFSSYIKWDGMTYLTRLLWRLNNKTYQKWPARMSKWYLLLPSDRKTLKK